MPTKRLSEDARLAIEGSRKNLEHIARQTLELMDQSEAAMTSDNTAQPVEWRTQDASAESGKNTDTDNRTINSQSGPDKSADLIPGGRAQQIGSAGTHGTQRVANSGEAGYKQPTIENGGDE